MKKIIFAFAFASILWSSKTYGSSDVASLKKEEIHVNINLTEIKDDKVLVTVKCPKIKTDENNAYIMVNQRDYAVVYIGRRHTRRRRRGRRR